MTTNLLPLFQTRRRRTCAGLFVKMLLGIGLFAPAVYSMHLSEGILPARWAGLWFVISIPLVALGLRAIRRRSIEMPQGKALVGLVGAAVFIVSCMPVPVPFIGTCSHPCGTGLAAILIGPLATVVVSSIALLLQALFLCHGGFSTLGADILSMGIAGGFTGYLVFHGARRLGVPLVVSAFLAGLLSDWATYTVTSAELALALHNGGGAWKMFMTVLVAFAPTQVPLGIAEGIVSAAACSFILSRRPELAGRLFGIFTKARKVPQAAVAVLFTLCLLGSAHTAYAEPVQSEKWPGVDVTVVEKMAEQAGRPARTPLINTDQGDLLLFLFLVAGAGGGFAAGYWFRQLFPPRKPALRGESSV